jgi:hypothetical protein
MKAVYKMCFECGRSGELTGIFVEDTDLVDALIESGIEVYFGDALGKHSEISGPVTRGEVTIASTDLNAISVIEDLNFETGYNPFDYTVAQSGYLPEEIKHAQEDDWSVREAVKLYMKTKAA